LSYSGTIPRVCCDEVPTISRHLKKSDPVHLQEFADAGEASLHICIYFFLGKTDKCSRQIRKQAFKLQTPYERFFAFFPFADIPEDPTSADDLALTISYRRNRDGNIDLLPLFRSTNRFVTLNMFAIFHSPLYVLRFIMTTVGNNYFDRLSY